MANIISPACVGDSDSDPLQSDFWRNGHGKCKTLRNNMATLDTRREFALAIADFGIAYNTALEAINPEPFGDNGLRDKSALALWPPPCATCAGAPSRHLVGRSRQPVFQLSQRALGLAHRQRDARSKSWRL